MRYVPDTQLRDTQIRSGLLYFPSSNLSPKGRGIVRVFLFLFALFTTNHHLASAQSTSADVRQSVCRIHNQLGGSSNVGSGTLVDKTPDGRHGLVLTCAHIFREGTGRVLVEFSPGRSHVANLLAVDRQADLAALAIKQPSVDAAPVSLEIEDQQKFSACGYGPRGVYRCAVGRVVGHAVDTGQMSMMIDDPVRSGDSGGGVFDQQGRLVAVIWGEAEGVTYASTGRPLREFLHRVLGQRRESVFRCPGGVCPAPSTPQTPNQVEKPAVVEPRWQELQSQIDRLQREKQDRGEYVTRADLNGFASLTEVEQIDRDSTQRHTELLERIAAYSKRGVRSTVMSALGISGPMGWGIVAATTVGGWLVGRLRIRRKRGARGRRRRPFRQ